MFKYVQVTGCCSLPRTILVSGLRSTVMDWFFCFTEFQTTRMPCSQLRHEPCSGPKPKAWTGRVGVLLCDERCETGPNTEIDRIHMNTPKGSIEFERPNVFGSYLQGLKHPHQEQPGKEAEEPLAQTEIRDSGWCRQKQKVDVIACKMSASLACHLASYTYKGLVFRAAVMSRDACDAPLMLPCFCNALRCFEARRDASRRWQVTQSFCYSLAIH